MRTKVHFLFIVLVLLAGIYQAAAQGATAFTYQGQLRDGGTNANGTYTMIFKLYDAVTSGDQIGSDITSSPTLANGLFTVNLDFGVGAFDGNARWLDITITNGGAAQELSPRVQVLPAPYAIYAAVAATVTNGAIMNAQMGDNAVDATNIASGQVVKGLNGLNDAVSLLAGANLVLTTNGNVLQLTAGSNTVTAVDGYLKIVKGIIVASNGTPTVVSGSGFTLSYVAAGTGGYSVSPAGIPINPGQGGTQFGVGPFAGNFPVGEWIMAQSGTNFYQVTSVEYEGTNSYGVNQYTVTINPGFQDNITGPVNFLAGMTLNPVYTITFTTPFSAPPNVLVCNAGGVGAFDPNPPDSLSVSITNAVSALSTFNVISGNSSLSLGRGGPIDQGGKFDFIAIGPQ